MTKVVCFQARVLKRNEILLSLDRVKNNTKHYYSKGKKWELFVNGKTASAPPQ